ncbi:hypothetical protein, partial [Xanthomonas axonopodis]|uniref:hypothetical protein n=1 Tax=Xanthomonas axonopodis TaxID=53413 RepID=UPI001C378235
MSLLAGFMNSNKFLIAVNNYEELLPRIFRGRYAALSAKDHLISPDLQPPVAGSAPRWVDAAVTLKPSW